MPFSWLEELLSNLMMAGDSASEVQEVIISEDDNSLDGPVQVVRRKPEKRFKLPFINVPEKIILCLDVTPSCSKVVMSPDKEVEPLVVLKQSVLILVQNKLSWSPQSEIAIIILNGSSVHLYLPFTNDKTKIIDRIKRINVPIGDDDMEADPQMPFSLDELFVVISERIELPEIKDISMLPPHIFRCILFYSRTKLLSYSQDEECYRKLFSSRYFIFDSIFLHDSDLDNDVRKEIILALADLDSGYSYILESDNNAINFMNTFSKLAAHPLQRPHQSEMHNEVAFYKKLLLS